MSDSPRAWHILSYPRSGNHLVRAVIEFSARRPTLGVIESANDPPIHLRGPNRALNLIEIRSPEPIGYKSHWLNQVRLVEKSVPHTLGLIFIRRDMGDAIFSQLYRTLGGRFFVSDRTIRLAVRDAVNHYLAAAFFFESYDAGPKVGVRFEELASSDATTALAAARRFLGSAGIASDRLDDGAFAALTALARASQSCVPKNRRRSLERRIRTEIARYS